MCNKINREIVFYKGYFLEFYYKLDKKTQEKIEYVFDIIRYEKRITSIFLKYLKGTEKLYEVRVKSGKDIYRILCFFDKGALVVLLNGFKKKDKKTPQQEIRIAEKLRKEYYEEE